MKQKINIDRLKRTLNKSADIGKIPGNGLRRLALSDEDKIMRDLFLSWMEEANLETRIDDYGNMYGRREGREDLSPIVIGSHLDTQPNGGRFDGILGVLAALEVIQTLNDQNVKTLRPIEIINFTNEEGARFEPPMIASGGLSGNFEKEYIYNLTDQKGNRFEDELIRIGYKGKKENRIQNIHSYVELHIEQGPILEEDEIDIGVVEGIQGMEWMEITVRGESGHAGSTPMHLRKDALSASAKMINTLEELAIDQEVMSTVGRLSLKPNTTNSVPGEVSFSLDVRHFENNTRKNVINKMKQKLEEIASHYKVDVKIQTIWEVPTVEFNSYIVDLIEETAINNDYSVKRLHSGAGHDAKYMQDIAPTGMIFVPSVDGKSHIESELTLDKDIEQGTNALYRVTEYLANIKNAL